MLSTAQINSTKVPKIHTATLNFILFMTLKNGKVNSILFQVFHTEYEPCCSLIELVRNQYIKTVRPNPSSLLLTQLRLKNCVELYE